MKAFLIDTPNQRIVEVDYNGDYKTISEHLKCELFTLVYVEPRGPLVEPDVIFVDDEGLINGNPHGWFQPSWYHQPLRGYGLIVGSANNGDSAPVAHDIETYRKHITFPTDEFVRDNITLDTSIKVRSI